MANNNAVNNILYGVTDGSSAAAGQVGEVISSTIAVGSAVSLTTGNSLTITSITLTPGAWLINSCPVYFAANTTSVNTVKSCLSLTINDTASTSVTLSTPAASQAYVPALVSTGLNFYMPLSTALLNVISNTPVYLNIRALFTVSTITAFGYIFAVRFR